MIIKVALILSLFAFAQVHGGGGGGQGGQGPGGDSGSCTGGTGSIKICHTDDGGNTYSECLVSSGEQPGHLAHGDKAPRDTITIEGSSFELGDDCSLIPVGGSGQGDPHFKTWTGHRFDFHGQCDLVFLDNPNFVNGLGLKIYIRTKLYNHWSSIERAVIQIGQHTLEVTGDRNHLGYWINGGQHQKFQAGTMTLLADFPVNFERATGGTSQVNVDLGDGDVIRFSNFIGFLQVKVMSKTATKFQGSVGLMGDFPTGKTVGRDKVTGIEDANDFGQEWQVLDSEPMLFREQGEVHHPMKCVMPGRAQNFHRLGESVITEEEAAIVCASIAKEDVGACIFDVVATQDKTMVGVYIE